MLIKWSIIKLRYALLNDAGPLVGGAEGRVQGKVVSLLVCFGGSGRHRRQSINVPTITNSLKLQVDK